jgi:uncharacterized Tic20 family protein
MTDHATDSSRRRAVKVAGFMFLFALMGPLMNWATVLSGFIVADDAMATGRSIVANELRFRIGLTIELMMSIGLIVLAVALYTILKSVNKQIALFALLCKFIEAALVAAIVLVSYIAVQALDGDLYQGAFTAAQLQVPVALLLNSHTAIFAVPMVFLGVDMMLFSYLFLKSKYIPRMLASFGILSFALILVHSVMFMLAPAVASLPIAQIVLYAPSGLFEIAIGMWLLLKGVDTKQQDPGTQESA